MALDSPIVQPAHGYTSVDRSAEQVAAQLGMRMVVPRADQLFIDIDSEDNLENFKEVYQRMQRDGLPVVGFHITPSKTAGHYHVVVDLADTLPVVTRILLQTFLYSDRTREYLSYIRVLAESSTPIAFFEPK